jgi:hypothetical protein
MQFFMLISNLKSVLLYHVRIWRYRRILFSWNTVRICNVSILQVGLWINVNIVTLATNSIQSVTFWYSLVNISAVLVAKIIPSGMPLSIENPVTARCYSAVLHDFVQWAPAGAIDICLSRLKYIAACKLLEENSSVNLSFGKLWN